MKEREKERLYSTMTQDVFSSLWLLVVYTLWYESSATSVFCPSRPRQRFPSYPASSGAGCGCGRKTWWPSSLSGCSPAGGKVGDSAHSPPSQALAVPWGFSLGESPLRHALPLTRDASAHHASLWDGGRGCKWMEIESIGLNLYTYIRQMLTWFRWNTSSLMNIGYWWANWRRNGWSLLPWRSPWSFLLHHHLSFLLNFLLFFLCLRIFWKGVSWVARHYCRTEIKQMAVNPNQMMIDAYQKSSCALPPNPTGPLGHLLRQTCRNEI